MLIIAEIIDITNNLRSLEKKDFVKKYADNNIPSGRRRNVNGIAIGKMKVDRFPLLDKYISVRTNKANNIFSIPSIDWNGINVIEQNNVAL
jgi:hypothetical protein